MEAERNSIKLDSLNRAFEKAFAHTATKETLVDLLECIGEELYCDRISIFEINLDQTVDNTYEWCRPGATHVRDLMQNIPLEKFDSWVEKLISQEFIRVRNMESVRENDPDVYSLFHSFQVDSVIASRLAFHGKNIGFFILENPGQEIMEEASTVMPGMRYILSSLVYSDRLIHRLEMSSRMDHVTNTGNRQGLTPALDALDKEKSLGFVYVEVIGFSKTDDRPEHILEEQALIRTAEILNGIFGAEDVFRIAGNEFLALEPEVCREDFENSVTVIENLLLEHSLIASVGTYFKEGAGDEYDLMIRQAHMASHSAVKEKAAKRAHGELAVHDSTGIKDRADITLYRGDEFFKHAGDFLMGLFDESVLTVVIDINYFKLYNDIFGRKAGNIFLESMSREILALATGYGGVAGYLGGDDFAMVLPTKAASEDELIPLVEEILMSLKYPDGFAPAFGIYLSTDKQETLVAMYDHALSALQEIKGSYMEHFRFYDADRFRHDRDMKLLLLDVKKGLPAGEFIFYLQPQVHERTGKIVGAEALVRWNCKGQLVSPGQFIPALEKSGYIFAVDSYVWEAVVVWLRSRLDEGKAVVPISVNVSRVDFYFTDIADHFIKLCERYDLDPSLLGVEITESAFTDNTDSIIASIEKLHKAGFHVLMDDFGSGVSSLSMLHSMSLDILKTDVRFMSRQDRDNKAISIVESVISMAHMIGMMVVTEGVETEQQRDNLIALGDNYAQGFFFYRPMPVERFEELLEARENLGEPIHKQVRQVRNNLHFKEMIKDGLLSESLLENIIGAAAVIKQEESAVDIVQMNERFRQIVINSGNGKEDCDAFIRMMRRINGSTLLEAAAEADLHPVDGTTQAVVISGKNGEMLNVEAKIFLLYACEEHKLYFVTVQETTRICPCCMLQTVEDYYDICPVCGWENDPLQMRDPDYAGGANKHSLNEYRRNYQEIIKVNPSYRWSDK